MTDQGWREAHEQLVMNDELACDLAVILRLTADPEKARELRRRVAEVREFYLAGMPVPGMPRLQPAAAERRLKALARSLELGHVPRKWPPANRGARWLLGWASVEAAAPAQEARYTAERLIEAGNLAGALPIVRAAAAKAARMKGDRRHGLPAGREEDRAVMLLAEVFEKFRVRSRLLLQRKEGEDGELL